MTNEEIGKKVNKEWNRHELRLFLFQILPIAILVLFGLATGIIALIRFFN